MIKPNSVYDAALAKLAAQPKAWLVTGVAGFIGCNLLEALLRIGQRVVGLDNFSTGHRVNIDQVRSAVGEALWSNFTFVEADIRSLDMCREAVSGVDYVLHQAALGSVPRSIENPVLVNECNIDGFLNVLLASRDTEVRRFVYAASSSTYGDHPDLPKVEDRIGKPLSPYAVTKYVNELYAEVFSSTYGFKSIGLRYFNIFGPHQDPAGAYAAVIPRWIAAMLSGDPVQIFGDGKTSRDFCYVANAVQANILAATAESPAAAGQVYNIAVGERTTLLELHGLIAREISALRPELSIPPPEFRDFRRGDVRHSLASIDKARSMLGYEPLYTIREGLAEAMPWFVSDLAPEPPRTSLFPV